MIQPLAAAERTAWGSKAVAYTNAASVGNKWPQLRFRTLEVDVVAFTEVSLWLRKGENNLIARDY